MSVPGDKLYAFVSERQPLVLFMCVFIYLFYNSCKDKQQQCWRCQPSLTCRDIAKDVFYWRLCCQRKKIIMFFFLPFSDTLPSTTTTNTSPLLSLAALEGDRGIKSLTFNGSSIMTKTRTTTLYSPLSA